MASISWHSAALAALLLGGARALTSESACKVARSPAEKVVWLVRHGQAEHNVAEAGMLVWDDNLTAAGLAQVQGLLSDPTLDALRAEVAASQPVLFVTSPSLRCLITAEVGFPEFLSPANVDVQIRPDTEELGTFPCDMPCADKVLAAGSGVQQTLREAYEQQMGNFPGAAMKQGYYADSNVGQRLHDFTAWLASRPERNMLVIGHTKIFYALVGYAFKNAEARQYTLSPSLQWQLRA